MMSFKILSVNCRGLNGKEKRERVFRHLNEMDYDIYCLQETHFVTALEAGIKTKWEGTCFFDNDTSQSRGVAILFKKECSAKKLESENSGGTGRCVMVEFCSTEGKRYTYVLCCIYAPSDKDTPAFFEKLQDDIDNLHCENIILCGDFNLVLNQNLDCVGYANETKPKSREKVLKLMKDKHLIDIFREMNPNVPAYTFDRKENDEITKQSRLDFFLISENLWSCFTECCILTKYESDHSMITLSLKDEKLWEFDNSLLSDKDFVESIKSVIQSHVQERFSHRRRGAVEFTDQKNLEILLEKIKEKCISYSSSEERFSHSSSEENENSVNDSDTFLAQRTGVEEGESWNNLSGIIPRIKLENGQFTDEQSVILRETKEYYKKLYKRNVDDSVEDCDLQDYLPFSNILKLSDRRSNSLEGLITLEEAKETLDRMKSDDSPGSDGFTLEFFKFFWENLGDFVVQSINFGYENSMLSRTQRHGIITCLPEEDKPKHFLENWRPIPQLNTVHKIASGSIACRIHKHLEEILPDQTGFIHGSIEAKNIRLVYDIMQYTEEENIPGLLLLVEFKKAIDSLSWSFIQKALEFFNFGESIRKWIGLFHSKITSAVNQGGNLSGAFYVQRGCREGDPLSPLLFRMCVEILAIKIRESNDINGINFLERKKKIFTFTGDTLILMLDGSKKSIESSLGILREFAEMSGIHVNLDEAKGIWLGSSKCCDFVLKTPNEALKLREKTFKLHGIEFDTANLQNVCNMNIRLQLKNIREISRHWKHKKSTPEDLLKVFKKDIWPCCLQIFSTLPNPSGSLLDEFETELLYFAKESTAIHKMLKTDRGGIKEIMMSMKFEWMKDLLQRFDLDKRKMALCGRKYVQDKSEEITNMFWKDVLEAWLYFSKKSFEQKIHPATMEPLFFNQNILIENKTIFYENWFENNIVFVNDVLKKDGSIMLLYELKRRYKFEETEKIYSEVRQAIRRWLKKEKVSMSKVNMSHTEYINSQWEAIFNLAVQCHPTLQTHFTM